MKLFKNPLIILLSIIIIGLLIPQDLSMPVEGATSSDYNPKSFWYHPWGKSVTHKGVDIFGTKGTPINAADHGFMLYTGEIKMGGKVALALGPKWRLHYYAHLDSIQTQSLQWVPRGSQIETMGTSGNATGKQPHLHYSIISLVPFPWQIDNEKQGWKKMFYLNPITYLQ